VTRPSTRDDSLDAWSASSHWRAVASLSPILLSRIIIIKHFIPRALGMGPCMSAPSPANKGEVPPGQTSIYPTRSSSRTNSSAVSSASSPKVSYSTGSSHLPEDTTMSRQARPHTLDPLRTDIKKMSTIYDEEDDHNHDHDHDSAYGSVASPGMNFYAASTLHNAKPSTSTPLSSHPPRSSSTSSQNHSRPHVSSRSNSHTTICSSIHARSPSSNRIFDGSVDLDLQQRGYGYSVSITGTYPSKSDKERPRSSGSRDRKKKEGAAAAHLTPEEVFGLNPIHDTGLGRSPSLGANGNGGSGANVAAKPMSAYERRMAKRDQFTQSFIQPGQGPEQG